MSSNDMIRRRDAIPAIAGCSGPDEAIDAIRALPADPVAAAAVRLAEAADAMEDECCAAGIQQYLHANGWADSEASFIRMLSAIAAYRAAKHAGESAPCARCGGSGKVTEYLPHRDAEIPCPECVKESAAEPEPACTCVGMTVPWHDATCAVKWRPGDSAMAFAASAAPAPKHAEPAEPRVTCVRPFGEAPDMSPGGVLGRVLAAMPEPAPPACATCGGIGRVCKYRIRPGEYCEDMKPCPTCRGGAA